MKTKIDELRTLSTQKANYSTIPALCVNVHINETKGYINTEIIPLLLDIIEKQQDQKKNLLKLSNYLQDLITDYSVDLNEDQEEMIFKLSEKFVHQSRETTEMIEGVEL